MNTMGDAFPDLATSENFDWMAPLPEPPPTGTVDVEATIDAGAWVMASTADPTPTTPTTSDGTPITLSDSSQSNSGTVGG